MKTKDFVSKQRQLQGQELERLDREIPDLEQKLSIQTDPKKIAGFATALLHLKNRRAQVIMNLKELRRPATPAQMRAGWCNWV